MFIWKSKLSLLKQKRNNMNAKQMIEIIKTQEQELWKELQECIDKFGMQDAFTDMAVARWSTINRLLKTLEA